MKLACWNVNSVRARGERIVGWLEEWQPEVLCMQETKVVDEQFPEELFTNLGYSHIAKYGQKTYNGVAIVSKSVLEDVVCGFQDGEPEDEQARVIRARVDGMTVVNVYVPNGKEVDSDSYHYKLRWLERLTAYCKRVIEQEGPVLLCGDFNITRDDRDVWDPEKWEGKILCSERERKALNELLALGMSDAFRAHHEEGGLYSWWDYRMLAFPKKRGLRIDYIFVTDELLQGATACFIERNARKGKGPSDHAPVVIEISR